MTVILYIAAIIPTFVRCFIFFALLILCILLVAAAKGKTVNFDFLFRPMPTLRLKWGKTILGLISILVAVLALFSALRGQYYLSNDIWIYNAHYNTPAQMAHMPLSRTPEPGLVALYEFMMFLMLVSLLTRGRFWIRLIASFGSILFAIFSPGFGYTPNNNFWRGEGGMGLIFAPLFQIMIAGCTLILFVICLFLGSHFFKSHSKEKPANGMSEKRSG